MTTSENTPETNGHGATEDAKAKFREALDKKNKRQSGPGEAHLDGHSKAHGTHGPAAAQKDFRRKTG